MANLALTTTAQSRIVDVNVIARNEAPLGVDLGRLVDVASKVLAYEFSPVWGAHARLHVADDFTPGFRAVVLLDDVRAAGKLGYRDLTPDGLPMGHVFVKDALDNKEEPSTVFLRELFQFLVNPDLTLASLHGKDFVALEVCDPVVCGSYDVDGVAVPNFVYPAWFDTFREPGTAQFDHAGLCVESYELRKGGFLSAYKGGKWEPRFVDKEAEEEYNTRRQPPVRHARRSKRTYERSRGAADYRAQAAEPGDTIGPV